MQTHGDSQTAKAYFEDGNQLRQAGKLGAAIAAYRQAVKEQPTMYRAYHELGNTLQQKNQLSAAITCYLKNIEISPCFEASYHKLVWLELDSNELTKAITCCLQALQSTEQNLPKALIFSTLGDLVTKQGNIDRAIGYYQNAIYQQTVSLYPNLAKNESIDRQQRKPDFLIIGGMKCGTTSLYSYVVRHPQVLAALKKEIHFFDMNFSKGIQWYLSHFMPLNNNLKYLTGEATPCLGDRGVAEKIAQNFPDLKLIVILRNPIDRAYSQYNHAVKWFGVQDKFEAAIEPYLKNMQLNQLMLKDDTAYLNVKCNYLLRSLYVYLFKEWLEFFPREQFLILKSEDLSIHPNAVMEQVYGFLNLSNYQLNEYHKELTGSYNSLNDYLRASLNQYFQPHNQKLEELLKMKFNWN
jgi:tetratricopeptide (TPR) repeat protein